MERKLQPVSQSLQAPSASASWSLTWHRGFPGRFTLSEAERAQNDRIIIPYSIPYRNEENELAAISHQPSLRRRRQILAQHASAGDGRANRQAPAGATDIPHLQSGGYISAAPPPPQRTKRPLGTSAPGLASKKATYSQGLHPGLDSIAPPALGLVRNPG